VADVTMDFAIYAVHVVLLKYLNKSHDRLGNWAIWTHSTSSHSDF